LDASYITITTWIKNKNLNQTLSKVCFLELISNPIVTLLWILKNQSIRLVLEAVFQENIHTNYNFNYGISKCKNKQDTYNKSTINYNNNFNHSLIEDNTIISNSKEDDETPQTAMQQDNSSQYKLSNNEKDNNGESPNNDIFLNNTYTKNLIYRNHILSLQNQ